MKKFILAIIVAIAAVFPVASSAQSGDDMMNMVVKAINDRNNPSVKAAWKAPYLIMNVKIDEAGCAEINQLLGDKEAASMLKNTLMDEFISDPEMIDIFLNLEKVGMKGLRFNITDKLGAKATLLMTMADFRAYKDSKK